MKFKDEQIIHSLRMDARTPLTTLAKKTGIPTSTLFDRIKKQESSVIKGYTSLLNFERLGLKTFTILISTPSKKELVEFLSTHPNVNSLSRLGNGYDFMLEGVFRGSKGATQFIKGIKKEFSINDILTANISEDLKREGFFEA